MTKGSPTITIRLPEPLRDALKAEALKTHQTVTQLVQAALRASLPDPEPTFEQALALRIALDLCWPFLTRD